MHYNVNINNLRYYNVLSKHRIRVVSIKEFKRIKYYSRTKKLMLRALAIEHIKNECNKIKMLINIDGYPRSFFV